MKFPTAFNEKIRLVCAEMRKAAYAELETAEAHENSKFYDGSTRTTRLMFRLAGLRDAEQFQSWANAKEYAVSACYNMDGSGISGGCFHQWYQVNTALYAAAVVAGLAKTNSLVKPSVNMNYLCLYVKYARGDLAAVFDDYFKEGVIYDKQLQEQSIAKQAKAKAAGGGHPAGPGRDAGPARKGQADDPAPRRRPRKRAVRGG